MEENQKLTAETKAHLHRQLIHLGDMMGDGLHHETDGKWISREYRQVMKTLYPDAYKGQRKARVSAINENMAKIISEHTCRKCSGALKQTRSGSLTCACGVCGSRYKLKTRRVKK